MEMQYVEIKPSLDDMRKTVWATYFYTVHKEPLHTFCPVYPESSCKYQQAVLNGTISDFHHPNTLSSEIMDVIKPIFRDLSKPDLLKRCLGSHTQNPNESFNSVIWRMCLNHFKKILKT